MSSTTEAVRFEAAASRRATGESPKDDACCLVAVMRLLAVPVTRALSFETLSMATVRCPLGDMGEGEGVGYPSVPTADVMDCTQSTTPLTLSSIGSVAVCRATFNNSSTLSWKRVTSTSRTRPASCIIPSFLTKLPESNAAARLRPIVEARRLLFCALTFADQALLLFKGLIVLSAEIAHLLKIHHSFIADIIGQLLLLLSVFQLCSKLFVLGLLRP
ncbi:hypothetical protein KC341_g92 [Hortaea werneckii]|nr:hypothetical protein KC341_g92 [Hortaea werneckii]